jgi:hypothetical protein
MALLDELFGVLGFLSGMSSPVLAQIMVWIVEMQEVVPAFARLELGMKRFL